TRRDKTLISSGVHPHYVSVSRTMAKFTEDDLRTSPPELTAETDAERLIAGIDTETGAVVVQYPDILGRITDLTPIAEAAHAARRRRRASAPARGCARSPSPHT